MPVDEVTRPDLGDVGAPHWYAVYTYVHQEKRVEERLHVQGVPTFLPLYSKVHRWGKHRVKLEVPLFAGYVFARFCLKERLRILTTSGVCRIVGKGSMPEPVPDAEVDGLRQASAVKRKIDPHVPLEVGRMVRITAGPFMGMEGVLLRRKGQIRVVISIDVIASAFAVDVDERDVEPVRSWPVPTAS